MSQKAYPHCTLFSKLNRSYVELKRLGWITVLFLGFDIFLIYKNRNQASSCPMI